MFKTREYFYEVYMGNPGGQIFSNLNRKEKE
jgi:hypothetical protein